MQDNRNKKHPTQPQPPPQGARPNRAKNSKEKLKTQDRPLVVQRSQSRCLPQTKDVSFKKDKSKIKDRSSKSSPSVNVKNVVRKNIKSFTNQQQFKQPPRTVQRIVDGKKTNANPMVPTQQVPETGIARRYLKSQEPSPSSLITLTSRVKRREERMKRSKEGSWEIDERPSAEGRRRKKKAEDNYKEVFPEVKLDLDISAHGSKSDEQIATQPSPFATATTLSDSPRTDPTTKEAMRKTVTQTTQEATRSQETGSVETVPSAKPKPRYLPVRDPGLLSLACTQRLSQMLTPTEKSKQSRLLSLKSDMHPPRSQFVAMPDVLPSTGLPCIRNKDNDGRLIINGTPFWVEDMPDDLTDEGNLLNAAVILDVVAGKLSLVNMPNEQIVLDIYGEWETLRSRDTAYFNKDILFGNTIRSMVNLFDSSLREKPREARKVPETKLLPSLTTVVDPTTIVYYMRDDLGYLREVDFVASYKKKEPPKPCDM